MSRQRRRLICKCMGISDVRLRRHIREHGARTVEVGIQGKVDEGNLKWVEDQLREYVASDLEVVIYLNRDEEPWGGGTRSAE